MLIEGVPYRYPVYLSKIVIWKLVKGRGYIFAYIRVNNKCRIKFFDDEIMLNKLIIMNKEQTMT